MKLLVLAFGSRGDVQPLLPLCAGLCDAGYQVQLAAGSNFKSMIEGRGLEFVDSGIDIEALMNSDTGKEWTENSSASIFQEARNMKRIFDEYTAPMGDELQRISQGVDVLISNLPTFGVAQSIAERLGKRHIRIMLAPLTPTTIPASMMVPMVARRKSRLNYYGVYIGIYFTYWVNKDALNRFRQKQGQRHWGFGDFARAWNRMPVLYGVSPSVMPRDPAWNKETFVTGYWFDPPDDHWQPPAPLAAFLQEHPAPVYIGFGSMATKDPQVTIQIMVDALMQTGQAGII
jgi:UDP:flavonoid glycosyltransferase YjiC (YdhE family)